MTSNNGPAGTARNAPSPDKEKSAAAHQPGPSIRPRQSAFRLRRLPTSTREASRNAANPQQVRSMLDIDSDQQSIRLNKPQRKNKEPANPQPVRSMLNVDGNDGPYTRATQLQPPSAAGEGRQLNSEADRQRLRRFGRMSIGRGHTKDSIRTVPPAVEHEYDPSIVDMLDVVDPEVSTLSSITNVQNSLFVPSLGKWVNRRPTFNLSRVPYIPGAYPRSQEDLTDRPLSSVSGAIPEDGRAESEASEPGSPSAEEEPTGRPSLERIPSTMTDRFYAVRPKNTSLADWSDEDLAELNDHVRHMLHSRRSAFKRSMKAFGQYVRKPLGFAVTLYATLITLFGLAWVLFLIGWIYVGPKERQLYVINVIDNVLVALFAVVGDGLIPWRIVDTYHMIFIAHYAHLSWKLRDKMAAPDLKDKNDLPTETIVTNRHEQYDLEAARDLHKKQEYSVLTPQQQAKLEHHQAKFAKSHTFYKPHETETHHAFPMRLLIAIVVLLDCHSCFQLALGLCTWCIDYTVRPNALTASILSCSITVNITAGILISIGDRRTRKKEVVERMFRQELTEEAMRRIQAKKEKEAKEAERLASIQEEGRMGSGTGIDKILPKPALDFLHRNSDDSRRREKEGRKSGEVSRKSLDRIGRFDAGVDSRVGSGLKVVGSFPEEEDDDDDDEKRQRKDKDEEV